jgi:hypothetical protein
MRKTIITLIALGAVSLSAWAQFQPFTNTFSGSSALTITNAETRTINSVGVPLYGGRSVSILVQQAATNDTSANVTYTFQVGKPTATGASTNWATLPAIAAVFALNSATAVVGVTNLPLSIIDNAPLIRLLAIANAHTNNITITAVRWSIFP